MKTQQLAELVSGTLTAVTVVLSLAVVYEWRGCFVQAIKDFFSGNQWTAPQWLLVGVTVGFAGAGCDNLWWTFPWTAKLIGDPIYAKLMEMGIFFNIPFRQILGSIAAFCHIKASYVHHQRNGAHKALVWAFTAGATYLIIVLVVMP